VSTKVDKRVYSKENSPSQTQASVKYKRDLCLMHEKCSPCERGCTPETHTG
jgi:hypothetical protein